MSSRDRFPYETATVLDQDLLDACADNLTTDLEMVLEVDTPTKVKPYTNPTGNQVEITAVAHGLKVGNSVVIVTATDTGMAGTYRVIGTGFGPNVFRILKGSAVSPATGTVTYMRKIYASDRNKYVGGTFYEALTKMPEIFRTIGEWLTGTIEFSKQQNRINNVDGRFNNFLPEGADFKSWIGNRVVCKLGLREVEATYTTLFSGAITPEGGAARDVKAIALTARDDYERLSAPVPTQVFTDTAYPNIQNRIIGKTVPLIYGDWTVQLGDKPAVVFAFPVNGADPDVFDDMGARNNLQLVISINVNRLFDQTNVWLRRGSDYFLIDTADVVNVSGNLNAFEIVQNGLTSIDGNPFVFETSDEFLVQVKGKAVTGGYHDNFVEIAREILIAYGGAVSGDFDANWDTYRDKASPSQSAIATQKCRDVIDKSIPAIEKSLSLLEQVRLEAFPARGGKLKINALHFEDFVAAPTYNVRNWDVVKDSWQPSIDLHNNFNRAKGLYSRMPDTDENQFETPFFKNQAAIDQITPYGMTSRVIEKGLVFPNHYESASVEGHVTEILRLASAYFEVVKVRLTWRSILKDIGDFVNLNVKIGSSQYTNAPGLIREIGIDPNGFVVTATIWSLQMVKFPGYSPGYAGIVGGYDAVITQG